MPRMNIEGLDSTILKIAQNVDYYKTRMDEIETRERRAEAAEAQARIVENLAYAAEQKNRDLMVAHVQEMNKREAAVGRREEQVKGTEVKQAQRAKELEDATAALAGEHEYVHKRAGELATEAVGLDDRRKELSDLVARLEAREAELTQRELTVTARENKVKGAVEHLKTL